jgi:hypothetical protein
LVGYFWRGSLADWGVCRGIKNKWIFFKEKLGNRKGILK